MERVAKKRNVAQGTNWPAKSVTDNKCNCGPTFIYYIYPTYPSDEIDDNDLKMSRGLPCRKPSLIKYTMQFRYAENPTTCTLKCSTLTLRCIMLYHIPARSSARRGNILSGVLCPLYRAVPASHNGNLSFIYNYNRALAWCILRYRGSRRDNTCIAISINYRTTAAWN